MVGLGALVLLSLLRPSNPPPSTTRGSDTAWIDEAWVQCRVAAQDRLKTPSTATFPRQPDEVRRTPGASTAFLIGHVDAQNSVGAMIRRRFICKMAQSAGSWTIAVAFDEP